jgi:phosphonoacetate hydrolase
MARLLEVEGIDVVIDNATACARFELPSDRIGDIVLISTVNKAIGTSEHRHDLAALNEPLRSHGGLTEQVVPFIVNRVLPDLPDAPELRNFDAFYFSTMAAAR